MSENDGQKKSSGGLRRVGKNDQKESLSGKDLTFPPDNLPELSKSGTSSEIPPEHKRFTPPKPSQPRRKERVAPPSDHPRVITPQSDRYPPTNIPRDLPPEIQQSPTLFPDQKRAVPPVAKPESTAIDFAANLFTAFFIVLMVLIVGYFAYIWRNPYSVVNLFPPATPLPIIITATFLPPTETPVASIAGTVTFTPIPESVLNPPLTPTGLAPLNLLTDSTPTPLGGSVANENVISTFALADAGVAYIPNENDRGCDWISIAGTITDQNNNPVSGLGVKIIDQATGDETIIYSGSTAAFGIGGFELRLGDEPFQNAYLIQLISPAGATLSPEYPVMTSQQCTENVAMLNFKQVE